MSSPYLPAVADRGCLRADRPLGRRTRRVARARVLDHRPLLRGSTTTTPSCAPASSLRVRADRARRRTVVPMAGVTMVSVHPTHRRRGLLVRMMEEQLDDVARARRAARRAHRIGGGDLRAVRLRHSPRSRRSGTSSPSSTTFSRARARRRAVCGSSTPRPRPAWRTTVYSTRRGRDASASSAGAPSGGSTLLATPGQRGRALVHRGPRRSRRRTARRVRPLHARPDHWPDGDRGQHPRVLELSRPSTARSKPRCGTSSSASTWSAPCKGHRPADGRPAAVAASPIPAGCRSTR